MFTYIITERFLPVLPGKKAAASFPKDVVTGLIPGFD
jgi:hypothetical protein